MRSLILFVAAGLVWLALWTWIEQETSGQAPPRQVRPFEFIELDQGWIELKQGWRRIRVRETAISSVVAYQLGEDIDSPHATVRVTVGASEYRMDCTSDEVAIALMEQLTVAADQDGE